MSIMMMIPPFHDQPRQNVKSARTQRMAKATRRMKEVYGNKLIPKKKMRGDRRSAILLGVLGSARGKTRLLQGPGIQNSQTPRAAHGFHPPLAHHLALSQVYSASQ